MMEPKQNNEIHGEGIPINLISRESLEALDSHQRIHFVLSEVKEGKVLILERGLNAVEEASLIEQTMKEIDHETFIGIEIQSYANDFTKENGGTWLDRLLKRKRNPRMAVIGPATLLKTIHKDGNVIQTMLVTREHVIEEPTRDTSLSSPSISSIASSASIGEIPLDAEKPFERGTRVISGKQPLSILGDAEKNSIGDAQENVPVLAGNEDGLGVGDVEVKDTEVRGPAVEDAGEKGIEVKSTEMGSIEVEDTEVEGTKVEDSGVEDTEVGSIEVEDTAVDYFEQEDTEKESSEHESDVKGRSFSLEDIVEDYGVAEGGN